MPVPSREEPLSTIAVRLEPQSIHIRADRRLAFQVLTAFDTPAAAAEDPATRVLSREGARLLVEFHTEGPGLMGGRKVYRTVEWVTPHEPDLIEFEGVEGPLPMLRDRLILDDRDGCTTLRYESEFGWPVGCWRCWPSGGRYVGWCGPT
jgi:hypothetical protein